MLSSNEEPATALTPRKYRCRRTNCRSQCPTAPLLPVQLLRPKVTVTPASGIIERNARVAVAGDGIVAATAFEFIEGSSAAVGAGATGVGIRERRRGPESGRNVSIGEIATLDRLDRSQCVVADRGIAMNGASGEINNDAAGDGVVSNRVVDRAVEAVAAVDQVVAAASEEIFVPAPLSRQAVIVAGSPDGINAAQNGVVADTCVVGNSAVCRSGLKIDGDRANAKL